MKLNFDDGEPGTLLSVSRIGQVTLVTIAVVVQLLENVLVEQPTGVVMHTTGGVAATEGLTSDEMIMELVGVLVPAAQNSR